MTMLMFVQCRLNKRKMVVMQNYAKVIIEENTTLPDLLLLAGRADAPPPRDYTPVFTYPTRPVPETDGVGGAGVKRKREKRVCPDCGCPETNVSTHMQTQHREAWLVWKAGGNEGQREELEVDVGEEVGAEEEMLDVRGFGEGVEGSTGSPCGLGRDQREEVCGVPDVSNSTTALRVPVVQMGTNRSRAVVERANARVLAAVCRWRYSGNPVVDLKERGGWEEMETHFTNYLAEREKLGGRRLKTMEFEAEVRERPVEEGVALMAEMDREVGWQWALALGIACYVYAFVLSCVPISPRVGMVHRA